jgi:acyl-CoA dehydrogenase
VAVVGECIEAFGGAGYVEDTGLPALLRDTHVLPIWEGTTNVLSLDALRALGDEQGVALLLDEVERHASAVRNPSLCAVVEAAREAIDGAVAWLEDAGWQDPERRAEVEAGARRFALTVGRALEVLLLAEHAQWALEDRDDFRPAASAHRLAEEGIGRIGAIAAVGPSSVGRTGRESRR